MIKNNKIITIGSIFAVTILILASLPTIGSEVVKEEKEEYANYADKAIELVFLLITKLRNHKDIENVASEDDVLQIIESDEELNSIYEQLSDYDCGCDDGTHVKGKIWPFPIICILIGGTLLLLALNLWRWTDLPLTVLGFILDSIDTIFDCAW